jgi:hypothetical protein
VQVELRINSTALLRQIQVFEDRAGRGAAEPIVRDALLRSGDRLLAYYRRRFYRNKSTRGWPRLAKSTIAQKKRKGTYQKGALRDTDALFRSLMPGQPNNIRRIVSGIVVVGSSDPKLKYHQAGTKRMPQRKVIVPPDNQTIAEMDRETVKGIDLLVKASFRDTA